MTKSATTATVRKRPESVDRNTGPFAPGKGRNFLYAFESSWDYDPEPNLGKIKTKLLALNFADDMINAVEIDVMDQAVAKIPNGRTITMTANKESFGHMNQFHPEIWKHQLAELLKSLP